MNPTLALQQTMRTSLASDGMPADQAAAVAEALSTSKANDAEIESKYRLARGMLSSIIESKFSSKDAMLEFIEQSLLNNALLANQQFVEQVSNLDAMDSARAASLFIGKFVELRKARENDFKGESVTLRLALEMQSTLSRIGELGISSQNLEIIDVESLPIPDFANSQKDGANESDEATEVAGIPNLHDHDDES